MIKEITPTKLDFSVITITQAVFLELQKYAGKEFINQGDEGKEMP